MGIQNPWNIVIYILVNNFKSETQLSCYSTKYGANTLYTIRKFFNMPHNLNKQMIHLNYPSIGVYDSGLLPFLD
jgi:hypothetical protein